MNCTKARHDMSRSLDRRLDAVAQRELAEHLMRCEPCKREYHGLRKAMEHVHLAQPQRVSAGFRDKLMRRIESGEGTPEGALRPIIPLRDKVRFFLVGAAAAALLLLAAGTFLPFGPMARRVGPKDESNTNAIAGGSTANGNAANGNAANGNIVSPRNGGLVQPDPRWGGIPLRPDPMPGDPSAQRDVLQPVTTGSLASMVLDDTASAYRKLWSYAADAQPVELPQADLIPEVRQLAARVNRGWHVIHKLGPDCLIADQELIAALERAQPIAADLIQQTEPREIVARLQRLRTLAIPPLREPQVRAEACPGPDRFVREILDDEFRDLVLERILVGRLPGGMRILIKAEPRERR